MFVQNFAKSETYHHTATSSLLTFTLSHALLHERLGVNPVGLNISIFGVSVSNSTRNSVFIPLEMKIEQLREGYGENSGVTFIVNGHTTGHVRTL